MQEPNPKACREPEHRGQDLHVAVSDQGIGLPKDFDLDQRRASLGFKVIKSLVGQHARITVSATRTEGRDNSTRRAARHASPITSDLPIQAGFRLPRNVCSG
jgi:hypothetical protein